VFAAVEILELVDGGKVNLKRDHNPGQSDDRCREPRTWKEEKGYLKT